MSFHSSFAGAALALGVAAQSAFALGADVTPGIIFGSGNANGGFKVETSGPLELGLRAKLRYDTSGTPQNVFPFDGVDTYTFAPSDGNAPSNRAIWSFEWSVNTDTDGTSGKDLDAFSYLISLTGPDGYSVSYNPFGSFRAVALGDNSTVNGGGVGRTFIQSFLGSIPAGYNVAQESENIGFGFLNNSNPQALGMYTVSMSVFDGSDEVLSNNINVNVSVIPVPAALPLMGGVFALFGVVSWRKRRQAA